MPVPFATVFQPAKEYPVLTKLPVFDGNVIVEVIALTIAGAVPPEFVFPSNVITAFHCAYSVLEPVDVYVVRPDVYGVPVPSAAVFQPSNM